MSKLKFETAVANHGRIMEPDTISKTGLVRKTKGVGKFLNKFLC